MEASVKVEQKKLLFLYSINLEEEDLQMLTMLTAAGYAVSSMNAAMLMSETRLNEDELAAILADDEISFELLSACVSFIRRTAATLPVLLVCQVGKMASKELNKLLEAGVNDYVIKPIRVKELMIRMEQRRAQLLAKKEAEHPMIRVADLEIVSSRREVYRAGAELQLTVKEYDLLIYLVKHVNQVCSREDILKNVWHVDFRLGTNVVDVYIKHLREKIDKGRRKKLLQTVRGIGYMLKTEGVLKSNGFI